MEKELGTLIKVMAVNRPVNGDKYNKYTSVLTYYVDKDGNKKMEFTPRAIVPYSIINDKDSLEALRQPLFIDADKVTTYETFSDNLYKDIATKCECQNFYNTIKFAQGKGSNASEMKNIFRHPWVYDADMEIADRYIQYYMEKHEANTNYKLTKCFFDIEDKMCDRGIEYIDFPDEEKAPIPIELCTLLDQSTMTFHSYVLVDQYNESQKDMLTKQDEFKEYVKSWIKENDDLDVNIEIHVCDKEEDLITGFFNKVHEINPDYCFAWNAGFDCLTLMNRLVKLRSRDQEYISKFNEENNTLFTGAEIAYYEINDKNSQHVKNTVGEDIILQHKPYYKRNLDKDISDRTENFTILDGTNWLDQMGFYAAIRKSGGARESYSLDSVANDELHKEKLPFDPGETIKNISYKNFWKFFHYNIVDVLRLYQLEAKGLDAETVQQLSDITYTRKEKVFTKTTCIKNFISRYARSNNSIMANNKNAKTGDDQYRLQFNKLYLNEGTLVEVDQDYKDAFSKKENFGAYVGDPLQNGQDGIKVFGNKRSNYLFGNVIDFDFSALYPSIIRALNLDATTEIGKFFMIDKYVKDKLLTEYDYQGLFATSKSDQAKADMDDIDAGSNDMAMSLVDSVQSQDWSRIGNKFFNLPTTEEIINKLKK